MSVGVLVADYQYKHVRSEKFYYHRYSDIASNASKAACLANSDSPTVLGKSVGDRGCTSPIGCTWDSEWLSSI